MSATFRPEVWEDELREQIRKTSHLGRFLAANEYSRQGHTVVTPYTDAELQARTEAVTAWQKLTDELLGKGWLDDYPDDGYMPATETEHREWVYDESTDEHKARVALLPKRPATVSFEVRDARRPLNDDSMTIVERAVKPRRTRHPRAPGNQ